MPDIVITSYSIHYTKLYDIAARRQLLERCFVERFAKAETDGARKYCYVFVRWMPVGRDLVSGRDLQSYDEDARCARIAGDDRERGSLLEYGSYNFV